MTLWLVRAGKYGEHEARFLDQRRIFVTWDDLKTDLSKLDNVEALRSVLNTTYPDASEKVVINWSSQLWPFTHVIKPGDWVVLPRKAKQSIAIGEVTGPYEFHPDAENPYYHSRTVKWLNTDIPRTSFGQDLLYSFGAFLTICQVERNNAEKRVRAMGANGWKPETIASITGAPKTNVAQAESESAEAEIDLEPLAKDQIAKLIGGRFKGHNLTRLVEGILQAQGYRTFRSPPGPDKGIDILAASGALGLEAPMICVQVKSEDSPVDSPTLNQLIGAMQNVGATKGLLVGWGGFKSSVEREIPNHFFRVRLWNQVALIDQLLQHYERLDEDLRAELPLKRIWTVVPDEKSATP